MSTHLADAFAAYAQGQLAQAIELCDLALSESGSQPDAWLLRAVLYRQQGAVSDAVGAYRRAIALKPDYRDAWYNLGYDLTALQRTDEAIAAYEQTLRIEPDHAPAWNALGHLCMSSGALSRGVNAMRQASALDPGNGLFARNLALALLHIGQPEAAEPLFRQACQAHPADSVLHSQWLALLPYLFAAEPGEVIRQHKGWADAHTGGLAQADLSARDRHPGRRLRVAYVAAHFREDGPGACIVAPFEHHDRAVFEVFAYSEAPLDDAQGERFRVLADHWRDTWQLDDANFARQVLADGIDILVDLTGHASPRNRWRALGHRPAPLQFVWQGHAGCAELAAVDAVLGSAVLLPAANDRFLSCRPLRLPFGAVAWQPPREAPVPTACPAQGRGFVTLGVDSPLACLSPAVLRTWARLCEQLPTARLRLRDPALSDAGVRQSWLERFQQAGIDAQRILVAEAPGLAFHEDVDVLLDTFPVSAGHAVCTALWMGVPAVTLPGSLATQNVAADHLQAAGLGEWVAADEDAYVAMVVALAQDTQRLALLRTSLREMLTVSPLCQGLLWTRHLERHYRSAWQSWCAGIASVPDEAAPAPL